MFQASRGKGKGKSKKGSAALFQKNTYDVSSFPSYEKVERLRTLDIFAGCGGWLFIDTLKSVSVVRHRIDICSEIGQTIFVIQNNDSSKNFNNDQSDHSEMPLLKS